MTIVKIRDDISRVWFYLIFLCSELTRVLLCGVMLAAHFKDVGSGGGDAWFVAGQFLPTLRTVFQLGAPRWEPLVSRGPCGLTPLLICPPWTPSDSRWGAGVFVPSPSHPDSPSPTALPLFLISLHYLSSGTPIPHLH